MTSEVIPDVTVVIPIGPNPSHAQYLEECLASIRGQTVTPSVLLVDDMSVVFTDGDHSRYGVLESDLVWHAPWRIGIPAAFNAGVAFAPTELVVMLGADDWLEPDAVERIVDEYRRCDETAGYYYCKVRYSDTGEIQTEPCNCAAVTKGLWQTTGGFPTESAVGACDTMLISILMRHLPKMLKPVQSKNHLFNYRRHDTSDTATRSPAWQGPIFAVRDLLTTHWQMPMWGRMQP